MRKIALIMALVFMFTACAPQGEAVRHQHGETDHHGEMQGESKSQFAAMGVAAATNGNDFSRLTEYGGQPNDSVLVVCDRSVNGYQAVARGGNDGGNTFTVKATGGAGTCNDRYLGFNAGWHDACVGPDGRGCGGNSDHGS